ncbi:MAG: 1,4-dihydroxy-2-naphthoate octaprenyltransferase [Sulfolobales archaeon]
MSRLTLYLLALRPWSFPMTAVSISVGATYAYSSNHIFDPAIYLITLLGSIALHSFVNITNDYFDTMYGVDRPGAPTTRYRPHPIISGIMTPSQAIMTSIYLFAMALAAGIYLAIIDRWLSIPLGILGVIVALEYTAPPAKLKYRGFGEAAVFLMWGPLMVLGSYYTQTGYLEIEPIIVSIPIGILVASVLLIDSIRDYEYDRSAGIKTLTVMLGKDVALKLFTAMITIAYVATPIIYITGIAGPWILAPLITTPRAINLVRSFHREMPDTAAPQTAQLTMLYGIAMALGLALQGILQ